MFLTLLKENSGRRAALPIWATCVATAKSQRTGTPEMQKATVTDDGGLPLNDFEEGFLRAVLFMRGVRESASFEGLREALLVLEGLLPGN